jgi:low temperature requirement protein LtrA
MNVILSIMEYSVGVIQFLYELSITFFQLRKQISIYILYFLSNEEPVSLELQTLKKAGWVAETGRFCSFASNQSNSASFWPSEILLQK